MNSYRLYDRIISVTLLATYRKGVQNYKGQTYPGDRGSTQVETIDVPFMYKGYKPNISVSLSMMPSGLSFNIHVELTNAQIIKNADIRKFSAMTVRLGYTGGSSHEEDYLVQTFTGPIMSSYIASPSPNSRVVFDGVAIGYTGIDIMKLHPYVIQFNKDSMAVEDVFNTIGKQLGIPTDVEGASEQIRQTKINFQSETVYAENAYSIITWMQSAFSAFAKGLQYKDDKTYSIYDETDTPGTQVWVRYQNDKLYLISTDKTYPKKELMSCTPLTCIKSASFSGPILNVQAPYNPKLQPGDIFYMDPAYYTGGQNFLNILRKNDYNPSSGCYRIIKMDVSFSTSSGQNEMTLMAIGVSHYTGKDTADNTFIKSVTEQMEEEKTAMETASGDSTATYIVIGKPAPVITEDAPPKDIWSSTWVPSSSRSISLFSDQFKNCATFQDLGQVLWGDKVLYIDDEHMSQTIKRYLPRGVSCWYFYPLIQICTYKEQKKKQSSPSMQEMIDINSPDALCDRWTIYIPDIDDFTELLGNSKVASIMQLTGEYRKQLGDWDGYKVYQDLYNYITYGSR